MHNYPFFYISPLDGTAAREMPGRGMPGRGVVSPARGRAAAASPSPNCNLQFGDEFILLICVVVVDKVEFDAAAADADSFPLCIDQKLAPLLSHPCIRTFDRHAKIVCGGKHGVELLVGRYDVECCFEAPVFTLEQAVAVNQRSDFTVPHNVELFLVLRLPFS